MPDTVLGPVESALNQTDVDPALLKLLFHQGSCRILVIRDLIKQLRFAIGAMGRGRQWR